MSQAVNYRLYIYTSLQSSVSREAVMSQISLCLRDGKPPFAQESACPVTMHIHILNADGMVSSLTVGSEHLERQTYVV